MESTILQKGLELARAAAAADEVPVGAVIFNSATHEIVATAFNRTEQDKDPLAHAELLAIKKACQKLGVKRLVGYSLFVTLEPCAMCAGAIAWARLDAVYFGAYDPKTGAINQGCQTFTHQQTHHKPTIIGGIEAETCGNLMTAFFKQKRDCTSGGDYASSENCASGGDFTSNDNTHKQKTNRHAELVSASILNKKA